MHSTVTSFNSNPAPTRTPLSLLSDGDAATVFSFTEARRARMSVAEAEVEAAYAEARLAAERRTELEVAFDRARSDGDEAAESRLLQAAKDFDDAFPSRDPLFEQFHAVLLFGTSEGVAA
ncbi:hypothetical protein [Streptomyces albus]|uniref:hypothetical protein n=1 Tax=Streptomyces albus TaxID=1888 RepID=UPI0024E0FCC2|nr:hypothetical protein [Streptomyces albus]GHJ21654.1 hypothetical protein TPA0909_32680 [Streptomyces albus]